MRGYYSIMTQLLRIYHNYTAKLSRGKTFAVVHKTHYSLENFRSASGPCHYVLYTANDSRGKLSRLAKKLRKPRKFSPSKVLPYTVHSCIIIYSVASLVTSFWECTKSRMKWTGPTMIL